MKTKIDSPGVVIPPPLFYVITFFVSIFIQKSFPLPKMFFETQIAFLLGLVFIIIGFTVVLPALIKFLMSKNTLITIKPANSLQTSGIYAVTRNPMYLGLLIIYFGISFLKGNIWTIIFIPLVILIINTFVISKEEKYLSRAFGEEYSSYRNRVRRWI